MRIPAPPAPEGTARSPPILGKRHTTPLVSALEVSIGSGGLYSSPALEIGPPHTHTQ